MRIECLGGVNEIGGNKILVEHKNTRIFLDFGMSFNQYNKFFSEYLNPRKSRGLQDFFELGLLPKIKGIYREDYLHHMGLPDEKKGIDGVFISHAHADHAQFIHFLRKDIPIYCSRGTFLILKVIEETGIGSFSDLVTMCEAYAFYRNKSGGLSKVTRMKKGYIKNRKFVILEPEKPVSIGSIKIEMLPVDHSLPGASACIIYSDEGNLVYTGDIRFHGYNEKNSKRFIEKAKSVNPKWMICEGTRISEKEKDSEVKVKNKISKIISKSKSLVFVEHPIRDLDRVTTIFQASKENNRELVVTLKQGYLINTLGSLCPFKLKDVKILLPPREWGLICSKREDLDFITQDFPPKKEYKAWEQQFIWGKNDTPINNAITFEELQKNPNRYVVSMNLWEINQLVDIKPKNAVWIKSACEPFSDEMLLDEELKDRWLKHYSIEKFITHASGHACGDEIREMIKQVKPDELIPVHTEHPELF